MREGESRIDRNRRQAAARQRQRRARRATQDSASVAAERHQAAERQRQRRVSQDSASVAAERREEAERQRQRRASQDSASAAAERERHAARERDRMRNRDLDSIQLQRARRTQAAAMRVSNMSDDQRVEFNSRNAQNQAQHRRNQGTSVIDSDFQEYLSSFDDSEEKPPLEQHAFVRRQQEMFRDAIYKYEMRFCNVCHERWPTTENLAVNIDEYRCRSCKMDLRSGLTAKFSDANDMIPLTLASGVVEQLRDIADASPLECMLVALACPVMRIVRHVGGSVRYQSHCANFIQNFNSLSTRIIPRIPTSTPFVVVVRRGTDGEIREARVRRHVVRKLAIYLIQNNPYYAGCTFSNERVDLLPEDGALQSSIVYVDEPSSDEETKGAGDDAVCESNMALPVNQQLENEAIEARLRDMAGDCGPMSWPSIGSQPLSEFNTQGLATMCFPELFLNGKGDPTVTARLRDVSLAAAAKHLVRFSVFSPIRGGYMYPFVEHERFSGWIEDMVQRHRVLQQANFCLQQNRDLHSTTIDELSTMLRNGTAPDLVQRIYKYTANVTGSDPYWFSRRRELTAQANQEGLAGVMFFTLSAADNHWQPLMRLLNVADDAPIAVRKKAVMENPHVVSFYFCRRVERAVKFLMRDALAADWIWYRYEFQMRGATHAHGVLKLKIAPNILDMVSRAYAGRKASEMLASRDAFLQMNDEELGEFQEAAHKDESIHSHYKLCVAASKLSENDVQDLTDAIQVGCDSERKVIQFHDWLVTTVNLDLPDTSCYAEHETRAAELQLELTDKQTILKIKRMSRSTQDELSEYEAAVAEIQGEIDNLLQPLVMLRAQAESNFQLQSQAFPEPHPCSADWQQVNSDDQHYSELIAVQRHKCVGTYCMRKKKRTDGTEYGLPYCRFSYPKDLHGRSRIEFSEIDEGAVRASFVSQRNDPRLNQYCSMHLRSWLANCDLQIVLDEEQAIRYLVKYASKAETRSVNMNSLIRDLIPQSSSTESQPNLDPQPPTAEGMTLVRRIALRSVGQRDKSKQEVMHSLLQEAMFHSDFTYVYIHLDKHSVRDLNPNATGGQPSCFDNLFDFYARRTTEEEMPLSFVNYARKYECKKGNLTHRTKRTVVLTYPTRSSEPASVWYYQYCKYFLVKHKPWHGQVEDAWGGPISDPDNEAFDPTDDTNPIRQQWYIQKFQEFTSIVDPSSLEMFSADAARLRRIRQECEALLHEEQDALGAEPAQQDQWMQMAGMAAGRSDADLSDVLLPRLDPTINWVDIRKTPPDLIDTANCHLQGLKDQLPDIVRPFGDVQYSMLNMRQRLAFDTVFEYINNEECTEKCMLIIGGPGTGKSYVIKAISRMVAEHFGNDNSVLRLGTTGTAAFVIGGATVHSVLRLPVNRRFSPLTGRALQGLQDALTDTKVIVVDEVSMMGKKMWVQMDQRLRQASGKPMPFGDYCVLFIGDYNQLPPVGDKPVYVSSGGDQSAYLLFDAIEDVVILEESQRQAGTDDIQVRFKQLLKHCEDGAVDIDDWNLLRTRFVGTASDSTDPQWDQAPHLFFDNKSAHEFNMARLQSLQKPIARLDAVHNKPEAKRKDSQEASGLHATLFLCEGADVMLTSNLWTAAGLHNGAKGKVVDFVYTTPEGPRSKELPESVVVYFPHLDENVDAFLPGQPKTVSIPTIQAEWNNGTTGTASGVYTRKQFPLMLSWAFTIHKSQGKTLDHAVVDLGSSEKCNGMTLVALSRVRHLNNLLLKPFTFERLQKVNKSSGLADLRSAMERLQQKNK